MADQNRPDGRVAGSDESDRALSASQSQPASITEAIFTAVEDAIAVFTVERDGSEPTFRFQRNNHTHEEQTGITATACRGRSLRDLLGESDGTAAASRFHDCVSRREPIDYEETLEFPPGTVEWQTTLTPVVEDGTLTTIVSASQAVSEETNRECKLQSLQREYETVFEHVQDALFLLDVDEDGTIRFQRFNERETEFTGKSTDDIRGKTPVEAFGDDLGAELAAKYRECLECREPIVYEETLELDGETTVWQTKLTPLIVDGRVERIVGSGREITTLKDREQALEESRNRLQALFDQSPDAIAVHDADGEIIATNEQNVESLGYARTELTSMNVTDYEIGLDREGARELWASMDIGETVKVEGKHERKDGSTFPVEVWLNKIEIGDEPQYLALGRDITERIERERELAAERDFLTTVIESLPYPFYVLNVEEYTIEYANSHATVETGDTCYELTHGRTQPCDEGEDPIPCPIAEIKNTDEPVTVEHVHRDDEGDERIFQVHANPIYDDDGSLVRLAESNIDITARVEYEQQLETQRDNLEMLNQIVRHDIRNDLQLVLAYADTLTAYVDADGNAYVEQVLTAARDAVEITETARDITQAMLQSDADRFPVGLQSVLESEVNAVRSSHERAVVYIDGTIPDIEVLADDMVQSLFRNLLKNAIKHNDKEIPTVTVTATRAETKVRVRIADNGPGIPETHKDRIFDEGEKGLESNGTGLGLHLVKTLVTRYDGRIWVEDNDPDGSIFVVELPVAAEETP
ncbi:PAS domain S-box protein [Natrinema sp. HArc-T2]|uniref:PAS domain-containing sensor histidine kinase n=1 Tax=Natrinema sp. HArc-T2 TaxID=3242701 RepID=UPI00359D9741